MKEFLENTFDHKTVIEKDDPEVDIFKELHARGIVDLRILDKVGCEAFAEMALRWTNDWLTRENKTARAVSVRVSEHEGNAVVARL